MYGSIQVTGEDGKKVLWIWDCTNDKPKLKTDMTKEEITASEKAKWMKIKSNMRN